MRPAVLIVLFFVYSLAVPAQAHFGMVVPDHNLVAKDGPKAVNLDMRFWHPMENQGLNLEKPKLEVVTKGQKQDVSSSLSPNVIHGKQAWKAEYPVKAPGVSIFAMTPPAYWEPAEKKYIIHLTKTIISAFGGDEGWDKPVGMKLEIVPMVKPFALYAGNVFTGKVLYKGKALGNAEVEVEFFNKDASVKTPDEAYVTQVVKTDSNGVFTYAAPWAGWWGFAALTDDAKMKKDGKDMPVELGGVIWVYFHPVPGK
jgi:cobalt/nickel transport protein